MSFFAYAERNVGACVVLLLSITCWLGTCSVTAIELAKVHAKAHAQACPPCPESACASTAEVWR